MLIIRMKLNYTKEVFCKIVFFLLFMLTEILAICPCDQVFSIVFWNELNLCQPINKDCKRPIPKELYEKNNNIATEQL